MGTGLLLSWGVFCFRVNMLQFTRPHVAHHAPLCPLSHWSCSETGVGNSSLKWSGHHQKRFIPSPPPLDIYLRFWGLFNYYWIVKVPEPGGWLGYSEALLTNGWGCSGLHVSPVLLSSHKSLWQLFDGFDWHLLKWEGKCWLYVHSAAGPHSWVIRKQSRKQGSLAWMVVVNMTAAASLGWWQKAGLETRDKRWKKTVYIYMGLTDPSHHMTEGQLVLLCLKQTNTCI